MHFITFNNSPQPLIPLSCQKNNFELICLSIHDIQFSRFDVSNRGTKYRDIVRCHAQSLVYNFGVQTFNQPFYFPAKCIKINLKRTNPTFQIDLIYLIKIDSNENESINDRLTISKPNQTKIQSVRYLIFQLNSV